MQTSTLAPRQIAAPPAAPAPALCAHCRLPVASPGARFCCTGCETVFGLLHAEGLARYYELAGDELAPVATPPPPPVRAWLVPFEERLAEAAAGGAPVLLRLDVQGLHCAACVWLLEELFTRRAGGLRLDVNPALGTLALTVAPGFALAAWVADVERFGYRLGPPLKRPAPASSALLLRLGVAVALAMNAMIFAVAIYAGLESGPLRRLFDAIVFGLATASVAVGGGVFVRSAWEALRRGVLHLDLPIALGIVLAYVSSTASWLLGTGRVYLDTLTVFIALMLLGRFLQERVLERNRRQLLDSDGADGLWTRRLAGERLELVRVGTVRAGDVLLVAPGDLVPVDAALDADEAACSLDWVNGEATPRRFVRGETVPAGAFNVGKSALRVVSRVDFADGALAGLLRGSGPRGADEARATGWWRRLARVYVTTVLALGAATIAGWLVVTGDVARALSAGAALLIVTCPCAFGIATPLAYELAQAGLRRAGLFVRSPSFLDRAAGVRRVVFDKTGTLTTGALRLADAAPLLALDAGARDIVYTLAASSTHPKAAAVAAALAGHARFRTDLIVSERAGRGVETMVAGRFFRLGAPGWAAAGEHAERLESDLVAGVDGRVLAALRTEETPRPDAAAELAALGRDGLVVDVLSGDDPAATRALAARLGLDPARAIGGASPDAKAAWVATANRDDTLMIGDGLNDALAVEQARCSGTPAIDRPFLPARTDFYFTTPGLRPVRLALAVARRLARVHRRNLGVAVAYNVVSVALAAAGLMSPLLCAVIMPVASITVVLATVHTLSRRSPLWKS